MWLWNTEKNILSTDFERLKIFFGILWAGNMENLIKSLMKAFKSNFIVNMWFCLSLPFKNFFKKWDDETICTIESYKQN